MNTGYTLPPGHRTTPQTRITASKHRYYIHLQQPAELQLTTFNPLMRTLKLQNNGPLSINTVIGTLASGWAVTFGTARRGLGGMWAAQSHLAVPNVTAHPSTATVPTSYYVMCPFAAGGLA